jgi:predicted RecB family nuclease
MSTLPTPFTFSQAALQDFSDCSRRFQLRYLERLNWPAQETEPAEAHEKHLLLGAQFHRLVQQHHLGVPSKRLESFAQDSQLLSWWQGYLSHYPHGLPARRLPEISLAAPIGEHRLLAKFDLLAVEPGERLVIVDWKTSEKLPGPRTLEARLQTKVYRYVLVEAGAQLNAGQPVDPNAVEMIYWFANAPEQPVRFRYDRTQHERTGNELQEMVATIGGLGRDQFPLTDEIVRCRFCRYRSLCDRGVAAGELSELSLLPEEEDLEFDIDLDQIAGIEF